MSQSQTPSPTLSSASKSRRSAPGSSAALSELAEVVVGGATVPACPSSGTRVLPGSQYAETPRALGGFSAGAIAAIAAADAAGQFELHERACDGRGGKSGRSCELVRARRPLTQTREHAPTLATGRRLVGFRLFEPEAREHVCGARQRRRPELEQRIRPRRERRRDLTRHGENLAALLEREIGGDQRAAALARLDHDGRRGEAGDDSITRRKPPGRG